MDLLQNLKDTARNEGFLPIAENTTLDYERLVEVYAGAIAGIDYMSYMDDKLTQEEMCDIKSELMERIDFQADDDYMEKIGNIYPFYTILEELGTMARSMDIALSTYDQKPAIHTKLTYVDISGTLSRNKGELSVEVLLKQRKGIMTINDTQLIYTLTEDSTHYFMSSEKYTNYKFLKDIPAVKVV